MKINALKISLPTLLLTARRSWRQHGKDSLSPEVTAAGSVQE